MYGVHTQYSVLARQETGSNGVTYLMPYYSAHGVVMVVRLGELNYKVNVVWCGAVWRWPHMLVCPMQAMATILS